jgi:hypothetical protein
MIKKWTEEMDAVLTEFWGRATTAEIANKIGTVTRMAVIGRAARRGLPRLQARLLAGRPPKPGARIRKRVERPDAFIPHRRFKPVLSPVEPLNIPFFDLAPQHCRYVSSGEGYQAQFCGHDRIGESSYCPFHERLAHGAEPSTFFRRKTRFLQAA